MMFLHFLLVFPSNSNNYEHIYHLVNVVHNDAEWFPTLRKDWFDFETTESIIRPKVKDIPVEQSHWLDNTKEGYHL
jgi:hypothetical protein